MHPLALELPPTTAIGFSREDAVMKTSAGTLSALDVIYSRRSVRTYTSETLPESTIRALLDAAMQAPSACDAQALSFVVVQNPQRLDRLSELTKAQWVEQTNADPALHLIVSSGPEGGFLARCADPGFDVFYGATTLVVICARRPDAFATADCWLAAENFMLAAAALGLGTCCIGAATSALNSAEMRLELGIPPMITAVAPIVVGVPAAPSPSIDRRAADVIAWK
jgi:nitroreductase